MRETIIKKGGTLWNVEKNKDVTEKAPSLLFDYCSLEEGVTLKDIFLLINKHMDIFKIVFGNWIDEIVDEGLNNPAPTEKETEIEYLQLKWGLESWDFDDKKDICGLCFPSFDGVGFEQQEDKYLEFDKTTSGDNEEEKILECKKGDRVYYGIEFTPTNKLINIPVKLESKVQLTENFTKNKDYKTNWKVTTFEETKDFFLHHIIHGIIYELSFCGSPKDRNEKTEDLNQRIESIHDGTAELVSWDDMKKEIEKNIKDNAK